MKAFSKRVMGLILLLSTTLWAQAICPMMLFPEIAGHCGEQKTSSAQASKVEEHACCPRTKKSEPKSSSKVSACDSAMSCCSVERAPAVSPKLIKGTPAIAVMGRLTTTENLLTSSSIQLEIIGSDADARTVLSLKEDLRI